MRWTLSPLVAFVVLLSAVEATARPPARPPDVTAQRPWNAASLIRSAVPGGVPASPSARTEHGPWPV